MIVVEGFGGFAFLFICDSFASLFDTMKHWHPDTDSQAHFEFLLARET